MCNAGRSNTMTEIIMFEMCLITRTLEGEIKDIHCIENHKLSLFLRLESLCAVHTERCILHHDFYMHTSYSKIAFSPFYPRDTRLTGIDL